MSEFEMVPTMSNREFLEKHAQPGRVGLAGGGSLIGKAMRQAQPSIEPGLSCLHIPRPPGRRAVLGTSLLKGSTKASASNVFDMEAALSKISVASGAAL